MMLRHRTEILKLFLAVLLLVAVLRGTDVSAEPGDRLWRYMTEDAIISSPAVGGDGTVYVGSCDHFLYAVNPDGTSKWRFETNDKIYSSPAIGSDGAIYVGGWDNFLYALNPDGTLRWRYPAQDSIYSSPAIGTDGTVYATSYDGYVYALNADGTFKWRYLTDGRVASSPVIGLNNIIYVGTPKGHVYAINSDGTLLWDYLTNGHIVSSPAIDADGNIYVGNMDKLYSIHPGGTLRWTYSTDGWVSSSPVIGTDSTIYVGSWDTFLYAVNSDGTLKWRSKTGHVVWSSPAIGTDGTLYAGSWDGFVYAIDADGTSKWRYQTEDEVWSSPAIANDGTIYVGSHDGNIYAIEGDAPWTKDDYSNAMEIYADSPWPRFGQNNFNLHKNPDTDETPSAQTMPSLELGSRVEAHPNEMVSVGLVFKNTEEKMFVEGIDVEIAFDANMLSPLEATLDNGLLEGGDYGISYQVNEEEEKIAVTIDAGSDYLFKGSGVIAYLRFNVLGSIGDTADLSFAKASVNNAYDLLGMPDDPTDDGVTNGSVSIVDAPVPDPPSFELPPEMQNVLAGGTLSIPLMLVNTGAIPTPVEGIDVEIEFDSVVLESLGATLAGGVFEDENYEISTQVKHGTLELTIYAKTTLSSASGIAAFLNFDVVGSIGDITDLTFAKARVNESDVNASNTSVKVVKNRFEISGNIGYYDDPGQMPVPNVQVTLEGDQTYSETTDENGDYLFSDIPQGDYSATPAKTDDLGGLSATDVSRISRYAAGLFSGFDDYQMIAADVTRDGVVSGTDASRVARYLAGLTDSLNDDGIQWVFIPGPADDSSEVLLTSYASGRQYVPLNADQKDGNFVAIRLGDVTGDWNPGDEDGPEIRSHPEKAPYEPQIKAIQGAVLTIPVVLDQDASVEGIDMTIQFDENVLDFTTATLGSGILEKENYLLAHVTAGGEARLVISANSAPFKGRGNVVWVSFDIVGQARRPCVVSLTKFDCNEASASGGFSVNNKISQNISIVGAEGGM